MKKTFREDRNMKATIKMLGLPLLAAAALLSCSREMLPETETPDETTEVTPTEKPKTHTILIKAEDGEDTRTQIGADNTSSLWSEGDRLAVYQAFEWVEQMVLSEPGYSNNGGKTMAFPVTFDYQDPEYIDEECYNSEDELYYKFYYRAVYPAENVEHRQGKEGSCLVVSMPSIQYPTADSFDPKADILTSRPVFRNDQPDELSLSFKRQTALAQMTLKNLPAGVKIYLAGFYSAGTSQSFIIDCYGQEEGNWESSYYGGQVLMKYPEGLTVPSTGEVQTTFMTNPLSLEADDWFDIMAVVGVMVTDEETGEQREVLFQGYRGVELPEGRELVFEAGDATVFSVNMTDAEWMEIPPFELIFSDETLAEFDRLDQGILDIPWAISGLFDDGGGEGPIKAKASAGDYIDLEFEVNHPWDVSFSEPWLWASPTTGDASYRDDEEDYVRYSGFTLYATPNTTGIPREATMTISSQALGEKTIRVVQAPLVLPTGITISAPTAVAPYTTFDVEAELIYPEGQTGSFRPDIYFSGDAMLKSVNEGYLAVASGTVVFQADFSYGDLYLESEPVEVTVTEGTAPTDWYFLVKRESNPYLVHRTVSGDAWIPLPGGTTDVPAVANDLAFSADGTKVFVAGAKPDQEGGRKPCLWTYSRTGIEVSDWNMPDNVNVTNGEAKKIVVEGEDIYILAQAGDNYGGMYFVSKNNGVIWNNGYMNQPDTIFDMAVENGSFYLSGSTYFSNWAVGNTPFLRTNGGYKSLAKFNDSDLYQQRYYPESVTVKDGVAYVAGYVMARDRLSHDHAVISMWNGETPYFRYRNRADWWWTCVHDMAFILGDHRVYVGESYYTNSSSNRQQVPVFYYDLLRDYSTNYYWYPNNANNLPLAYSGETALNEVKVCNGIPVIRGTVDGTTAFWEAPWRDPALWENTTDTVIGFVVK